MAGGLTEKLVEGWVLGMLRGSWEWRLFCSDNENTRMENVNYEAASGIDLIPCYFFSIPRFTLGPDLAVPR